MIVTRTSAFTGKVNTMDLPVTQAQLDRCWSICRTGTEHIQDVFPTLTADEREFLKTGVTPQEWDEFMGPDPDDDDDDWNEDHEAP
jgi:hypothetical protein